MAHEILIRNLHEPPSHQAHMAARSQSSILHQRLSFSPPITSQGNNSRTFNQFRRPRGPCQICGNRYHTTDKCRRRYDTHPSMQAHLAHYSSPMPSYSSLSTHHPWHPDIGATHHMTVDSQMLSNSIPYGGSDQIMVGNG